MIYCEVLSPPNFVDSNGQEAKAATTADPYIVGGFPLPEGFPPPADGCATIYIWNPSLLSASVGHTSILIGGDYLSVWPTSLWPFQPAGTNSPYEDTLEYGRPPDTSKSVCCLDIAKAQAKLNALKSQTNTGQCTYSIFGHNCSSVIERVLEAGMKNNEPTCTCLERPKLTCHSGNTSGGSGFPDPSGMKSYLDCVIASNCKKYDGCYSLEIDEEF